MNAPITIKEYPVINPKNSVKGRYFTSEEIATAKREGNPQMLNVSLYLGKNCNINCIDCFTKGKESNPENAPTSKLSEILGEPLSLEEYYHIIDECATLGTKTINLVGEGEPIIDPHFKEIVSYIYHKWILPLVATNGVALVENPDLIDFLYDNGATVVIKMRTFDEKFQDVLVQREGYAKEIATALYLLTEKWFNKETPTRLMANILAINYDRDILEMYRLCRKFNIIPEVADYLPVGRTQYGILQEKKSIIDNPHLTEEEKNTYLERLQPTTGQRKAELEQQMIEIDKEFWIERSETESRAYFCGTKCTQIFWVLVNNRGNVFPCVAESKRLGNIRKTTLGELWNSVAMQDIRNNATGGCPYKPYFSDTSEKSE